MMIALWKCNLFACPTSLSTILFINETKINEILASQATAGITLALCAGLWSSASLFQYAQAPKLLGTDTCAVGATSYAQAHYKSASNGKKLRALGSRKYLAHTGDGDRIGNEEVTSNSARPGLGPVFIFVLFSFCFSFCLAFVIYTNEQMLLIFSSLSILLKRWSLVTECLWPSPEHYPHL